MRKILACFLILGLMAGLSCHGETRQSVVMVEGEQEIVTETLCDTGLGFSFWYDAGLLEVDSSQSEDALSVMVFPKETDQAIYIELMSVDAMGLEPGEYLELYALDGTEYEYAIADSGVEIVGYRQAASFSDAFLQGYYIVRYGDAFLAAATTWPVEADEGWGARLLALLNTVAFEHYEDEGWE